MKRLADRHPLRLVSDVVEREHPRMALAGGTEVIRDAVELARSAPDQAEDAVLPRAGDDVAPRAPVRQVVGLPSR